MADTRNAGYAGPMTSQTEAMKAAMNRPPVVAPAPTLVSLVDQINERLDSIKSMQDEVSSAIDRITGPRPVGNGAENCAKPAEKPGHEARLWSILQRLDDVLQEEVSQAGALNGAI